MLPSGHGIQGKLHLDGRRGTTQTYGGGVKRCASRRRPIQNHQGRKGALTDFEGRVSEVFEKELDVFAWSHEDMPGIDGQIENSLNVDPTKKSV